MQNFQNSLGTFKIKETLIKSVLLIEFKIIKQQNKIGQTATKFVFKGQSQGTKWFHFHEFSFSKADCESPESTMQTTQTVNLMCN